MKKSRLVARAWLSIILLLVAVLLPHHHHDGGLTCVAFDDCHPNAQTDDTHNGHGHPGKTGGHPCVFSVAVVKLTPSKGELTDGIPFYLIPFTSIQLPQPLVQQVTPGIPKSSKHFDLACPFSKHSPNRGPPALLV